MGRRNQKRKRAAPASATPGEEGGPSAASTASEAPTPTSGPPPKKVRTFDDRWETAVKTPQEVLDMQMDTWRSLAYEHFDMPPEIVFEEGKWKYRFWCKKHPGDYVTRARTDSSTSNLNDHIDVCDPPVADDQSSIAQFASGSLYNKAKFRFLTTTWVVTCYRPFAIVEDPPLQAMFKMLYAKVDTPSAKTVSRDVKEAYTISKADVAAYLQGQRGVIHIAFDGWTAPNVISYLGVVVVFERSGDIVTFLLDFVRLRKGHTGRYLAEKMHDCLDSFGIADKIYGQTADNASNNDTMVQSLSRRLNGRCGPKTRVRCLCHVMNLCVRAMLKPFIKSKKPKKKKASASEASQGVGDDDDDDDDESGSEDEDDDDDDDDGDEGEGEEPAAADADDEDEVDPDREASDAAEIEKIVASVDLAAHDRLHQ